MLDVFKYNNILGILEKNINLLILILLAHIMHTSVCTLSIQIVFELGFFKIKLSIFRGEVRRETSNSNYKTL